jgi:hypothetical protein
MKFNNKIKTVLLDPNSKRFALDEKVNVILSPSLYWVKKLSLPIKHVREVKKLLPSLFEDTLPEGNYSYYVYKQDEDFYAFAYEDKKILDLLSKQGISPSNVKNVYFAQSELSYIEGAVKINETQSIYMKNDILILLPCCWIDEKGELDLSDVTLSKHSVSLMQYGHIIDTKSIYKISAILVVMIVLVFAEYLITSQKVNELREKKDNVFTKYRLKPTMFENKSILKKYTKIYNKQSRLREVTAIFISARLKKGESIKVMSYKNSTFKVNFELLSESTKKMLISKLKAKKFQISSQSDTTMEIKL